MSENPAAERARQSFPGAEHRAAYDALPPIDERVEQAREAIREADRKMDDGKKLALHQAYFMAVAKADAILRAGLDEIDNDRMQREMFER